MERPCVVFTIMLDREVDATMDVVIPAAAGSFRVLARKRPEHLIYSQKRTRPSLQRVDALFENAGRTKRHCNIKSHRALAGAYLRLLLFLVQTQTGLSLLGGRTRIYQFATSARCGAEAGPLVDVLREYLISGRGHHSGGGG